MSNLQRNSWFFFALMLVGAVGPLALGQEPVRPLKCAEYRLSRTAFLLGCCGDLPVMYPGDRFPSPLDRVQRATLALREIQLALRSPCPQDRPADRLDLLVNRVGAYVMRARAVAENAESPADIDASLRDATIAAGELKTFVQAHPDAALKIWFWIAMTFRRSGRPLETIWFLRQVEGKCCRNDKAALTQMALVKADTLFDLGMYSAAASGYSELLSAADEPSLCGQNRSLANVTELRRQGFPIKAYAVERSSTGVCVPVTEWEPYAGVRK